MGLKYLPGLRWVGSLSIQDADLLAYHGYNSDSVLEFGVGGSTLIFGQTSRRVVSVDTSGDYSSWMQDEKDSGRPDWSFGSNSNHDVMWEYNPNGQMSQN